MPQNAKERRRTQTLEKLKIAVIGAGNIARNAHLPVYAERDDVEIVAICDWNLDRSREIAAKFNIPHAYTTVEETLEKQPEIEAVDICVWNRSHAPVAIAAAKAGKHILCEKPMAWSVEHAEQMKKAVDEAGVTFMVAVMTRYANESQVLKAEIDAGRLGDIYYAKTGYMRRRGTPIGWFTDTQKSGGGPVIDIGIHCIDRTWYLMGKPKPVRISASTSYAIGEFKTKGVNRYKALDSDVTAFDTEDSAAAIIHFENGATMMAEVSWAINMEQDGPTEYTHIMGSKAGAKMFPLRIYGEENGYLCNMELPTASNNAYAAEIDHFIDCVRNHKTPESNAEDGLTMMKILEGIYTSAKAKKEIEL